jgi:hypothetical protein
MQMRAGTARRFRTRSRSVSVETSHNPLGTFSELRGSSDERTPFVNALAPLAENRFSLDTEFICIRFSRPEKGKFLFPDTCVCCTQYQTFFLSQDFVNAVLKFLDAIKVVNSFEQLSNCSPILKNESSVELLNSLDIV